MSMHVCMYVYMGGISQDVKTIKKVRFLPSLLWVFLTIYICVALMKITMRFKQLEASHKASVSLTTVPIFMLTIQKTTK